MPDVCEDRPLMPISPATLALRHAARIAAQGFRVTVHPDGAVTVEPVDAKPQEDAPLLKSGGNTCDDIMRGMGSD
jgi:hypothetical protein